MHARGASDTDPSADRPGELDDDNQEGGRPHAIEPRPVPRHHLGTGHAIVSP